MFYLLVIAATAISASPIVSRANTTTPNPPVNTDLITQIELAPSSVDRFTLIMNQGPEYHKFDFNPAANPAVKPGANKGAGGQGDLATRKNFPALIDLGIAASVGFLNPCGMNTPHVHPRATEFLTIAEGDNVKTGFILENGLTTPMTTTLSRFQGTIFPQGSIHYEFNDNCAPAIFIAGFNSEDPGLSSIAQNFFGLDPDIVDADLGFPRQLDGTNIAQFAKTIPPSFALGAKECLDKCGIKY